MKKTIIFGLCVALGLALMATVALAWGPGFGPGFGRGFGGPAYGSPPIPNLTAEQSSKIQTLREASLKEVEPLQKDLWTKKTEFRNLWLSSDADPAVIAAKQKEIEERVKATIDEAVDFAMQAPDPTPDEATSDLYA